MGSDDFAGISRLDITLSGLMGRRIFLATRPTRLPRTTIAWVRLTLPRPPIGDNGRDVVQEYQPVVHRLRLSASA